MGFCLSGILLRGILCQWDFVGILSSGKMTLLDFVLVGFFLGGILSGENVLWDFVWVGLRRVGKCRGTNV